MPALRATTATVLALTIALTLTAVALSPCWMAPCWIAEVQADEPRPGCPLPLGPAAIPAATAPAATSPAATTGVAVPKGHDLGRMHNVHAISARFLRGSQPEIHDDFRLLKEQGVKVIVSVDGARPDVAAARTQGLRYVHVPVGYGGLTRAQVVLLYKAFSTLEGPFYVHCHHGRHRGPAACAVGLMGVEGWTAEQAVAELKSAGTAAKYDGLYAVPAQFQKPTAEELALAPAELPESAEIPAFKEAMVEIDQGWERLAAVRKAKWGVPAEHPDVAPRHEALIFAEYLRELGRRDLLAPTAGADAGAVADTAAAAAADFRTQLLGAEQAAWDLAKALEGSPVDASKAEAAFLRLQTSCTSCHEAHRD